MILIMHRIMMTVMAMMMVVTKMGMATVMMYDDGDDTDRMIMFMVKKVVTMIME